MDETSDYLTNYNSNTQWCHGLKKVVQEVAIFFRQIAVNFWQRRLWVLKISILPLNCPKTSFWLHILNFGWKIF